MRRPDSTTLRLTTILIVAFALLAPKASVVLAALAPDGQRSVVLCTGTGLVRVTVGSDSRVVDDRSTHAGASAGDDAHGDPALGDARHCDLVAPARGRMERRWAAIGHMPGAAPVALPTHVDAPVPAPRAPSDPPPRGPPPRV